jgi:hypothetical protein
MKSFLKEIEDKFQNLQETCNCGEPDCPECNPDEIEEQNVTAAIAGFNTPAAFAKPGKWKGKQARYESVNTPPNWTMGEYQKPEDSDEEYTDKFPFATNDKEWQHKSYKYPSVDLTNTPGLSKRKDKTKKYIKPTVADAMDAKYEQLVESYRNFATGDSKTTPEQKVKNTIKEVAKKLQEIETLINHTSRLKTESGLSRTGIGPAADKALTKIAERLTKISERVRSLGE